MFPAKIKYIYKQTNSVVQEILLEKPPKPGTIKIVAHQNPDGGGKSADWADDTLGAIKTLKGTGDEVYSVNYKTRKLDALNLLNFQSNWKLLDIEYEANLLKDYLVVPLIGNGNTSIEDYWENVDKVTGISLNRMMSNLAADDKQLLDIPAIYAQTDNGQITQATLDMIQANLADTRFNATLDSQEISSSSNSLTAGSDNASGGNSSIAGTSGYLSGSTMQSGVLYENNTTADFALARIGGIVQTAINEGSKNMRDYFLYDFTNMHTKPYGSLNDPYSSDTSFKTTADVKRAVDHATAGGYTAALYGHKDKNALSFYSYSNGLYGDTGEGIDANKVISAQNARWSRDKLKLYDYQTIGTQRNNSILQSVEVIIGNTLIYMPCWPENVQDGAQAEYDTPSINGRSAPYVIYSRTGERSIDFVFKLHREMLDTPVAELTENIIKNPDSVATRAGEIDRIVRLIESAVYPNYDGSVAAVRTQVKIGKSVYISGVMTSQNTNWYGPIGSDFKYKQCDLSFTVMEVTDNPKSQANIAQMGGWRTS